jgi:hypothetical protein
MAGHPLAPSRWRPRRWSVGAALPGLLGGWPLALEVPGRPSWPGVRLWQPGWVVEAGPVACEEAKITFTTIS